MDISSPRWRGFNLPHLYSPKWEEARRGFREEEFRWISDWGFNFVRLPLDYRFFIQNGDWMRLDQAKMAEVAQAVAWCRNYGIHACINLHRAPGYCINAPKEPQNVWADSEAQDACELHLRAWARLLKDYDNTRVSLNPFNEPTEVDAKTYASVAARLIKAIHEESPGRLVILDGVNGGNLPVPELLPLGAAQALRGYNPMEISHYKAEWWGDWEGVPEPSWPNPLAGSDQLKAYLKPWLDLRDGGTRIMVGEWGAYNKTPHSVVLAWMEEQLKLWKAADLGWALWNLSGSFGILNSGRGDVDYADWQGQKLDQKMLDLLRRY